MARAVATIVVGAGISGLAYAQGRGRSAELLVLDAAPRAGGLVASESREGFRFERGPEALQDGSAELRALLGELALAPVPAPAAAHRRWLLREGALVELPLDPRALLRSDLLSRRGRLRALSEPFRRQGVALDGSVADFVRHRLGAEVLERLVDPFVTGVFAGDPEQLSLRAAFPQLAALAERHGSLLRALKARAAERRAAGGAEAPDGPPGLISLPGGLGALPDALATALGERLQLGARVTSLAREERGWRVAWRQGGSEREAGAPHEARAERLVLALPAAATARLLREVLPPAADLLGAMAAESVVCVAHGWRRQDVEHPLDGFGYLVPSVERRLHLGTLFSSSIAPGAAPNGHVLLRTLLGGARRPRQVDWPDDELSAEIAHGVAPLLGARGQPVFTAIVRWRAVLPRYDLAHPERLARLDALQAATPGLALLGNWERGLSVPSLVERARALARRHEAPLSA